MIGISIFSSCRKDDDISNKSCETLEQDVAAALFAYSNEASNENCKTYKELLQAQLDKSCTLENGSLTQKLINSLNCAQ